MEVKRRRLMSKSEPLFTFFFSGSRNFSCCVSASPMTKPTIPNTLMMVLVILETYSAAI